MVVQFSHRGAYDAELLRAVNALCERFGAKVEVRFYAHEWKTFDCGVLRELPAVRSLRLDTLRDVTDLQALEELRLLEEFGFGAFEAQVQGLLEMKALEGLKRLALLAQKKSNIDLKPLAGFERLEDLFLNKQARHIEVLAGNGRIRKLGLSQMGKSVRLECVRSMSGLRRLRVILGGRTDLSEMANDAVETLEVIRVQGLERVGLEGFAGVRRLEVEDQLRVEEMDLRPLSGLERLRIANCKGLLRLKGLKGLRGLRVLLVAGTKLDLEQVMEELPEGMERVSLYGTGARLNAEIEKRLRQRRYGEVARDFAD